MLVFICKQKSLLYWYSNTGNKVCGIVY